jgi:hypothetical protein
MREVQLPSDARFYEDIRLLVYRPRGVLNEEAVDAIVAALGKLEFAFREPFDRFFDTLAADEIELNHQFIIQISLYRRFAYVGRPPAKSAILATDATMVHYGRLHALLTQGSPLSVRVFRQCKDAAEWLGLPIERLMVENVNDKASR